MAITTVRVQVNGTWTTLTKNASTGKYEGTVTAPGATSYHLAGGYYPVTVEAKNDAGTVVTATVADAVVGDSLKLVVRETVQPVITVTSPGAGAFVTSSSQPVTFTLRDEVGGSWVDLASLRLALDGVSYTADSPELTCTAVTDGYDCVFTKETADGAHTVTVDISDHDGNAAAQAVRTYTVDTVPPVLNVTEPQDGLIQALTACTITGTTNDATSSPVTVTVQVNSGAAEAVNVGADGAFTQAVTLTEGDNTLVITAADRAGRESAVTLAVRVDTSQPEIRTVTLAPNPADAGQTMTVAIEVV